MGLVKRSTKPLTILIVFIERVCIVTTSCSILYLRSEWVYILQEWSNENSSTTDVVWETISIRWCGEFCETRWNSMFEIFVAWNLSKRVNVIIIIEFIEIVGWKDH